MYIKLVVVLCVILKLVTCVFNPNTDNNEQLRSPKNRYRPYRSPQFSPFSFMSSALGNAFQGVNNMVSGMGLPGLTSGQNNMAPGFGMTSGQNNMAPGFGMTSGQNNMAPGFGMTAGQNNMAPGMTSGHNNMMPGMGLPGFLSGQNNANPSSFGALNQQSPFNIFSIAQNGLNRFEDFLNPQLNRIITSWPLPTGTFQRPQDQSQGGMVGQANTLSNAVSLPSFNEGIKTKPESLDRATIKPVIVEENGISNDEDYDIDIRAEGVISS